MAPPKGPPKASGLTFGLIVASVSLILLLLWGWQSGWLMKAGDFLQGLVSPARYQGDRTLGEGGATAPPPGGAAASASQAGDARPGAGHDTALPEAPATQDLATQTVPDASQVEQKGDLPKPGDEMKDLLPLEAPPADEPFDEGGLMDAPKQAAPSQRALPDESAVIKDIGKHWSLAAVRRHFNLQETARRLVITVDQLSRHHVPSQMRVMRGIPDPLMIQRQGERIMLDPANSRRYDAFVGFAESLNAKTLVTVYRKFYPLLQHTFEEIGYPGERFHDRVMVAIDDMLAARQPDGPIELVQPKVLYRFEDPVLEGLSAGRKIMIRVGPAHAERLKTVLRRLRGELARRPPGG
ncbi:MAG: DUF3014 domain-containing protein [Lautropia sp.]|nr:DUF3014 domain-containing protein [Lautropia sp.]